MIKYLFPYSISTVDLCFENICFLLKDASLYLQNFESLIHNPINMLWLVFFFLLLLHSFNFQSSCEFFFFVFFWSLKVFSYFPFLLFLFFNIFIMSLVVPGMRDENGVLFTSTIASITTKVEQWWHSYSKETHYERMRHDGGRLTSFNQNGLDPLFCVLPFTSF